MGPEKRPNLSSSAGPLGKDNQVMPMARQRTRATAPASPHTAPPDIRPIPVQPPGEKGKHKVRNILLGTVVGAGAITSGGAAYDHHVSANEPITLPGITRDITAIPGQVAEWFTKGFGTKEVIIPSTFDNKADVQIVGPGINTITLGSEELHSVLEGTIKPVEKGKYPDESILFPVKVGNQNIISSTAYLNGLLNPFTGKEESSGIIGKLLRIPNKGTEIIVPVEGAEVFQLRPYTGPAGGGKSFFIGAVVRFKGPDGAFHYLRIKSSDDALGQVALSDAAKNAPFIGENGFFARPTAETDASKGMPLPLGTSILKTDVDNAGIQLSLITSSPILPAGGVRSPFNFVTQDGKIAIISTTS